MIIYFTLVIILLNYKFKKYYYFIEFKYIINFILCILFMVGLCFHVDITFDFCKIFTMYVCELTPQDSDILL